MIDTPIEQYEGFYVKRDDLATKDLEGAPPLAKMRGLYPLLENVLEKNIGYYESKISQSSWAVAWCCREFNKQATIYYHHGKNFPEHTQKYQLKIWEHFKVEQVPMYEANIMSIHASIAKKQFFEKYPDGRFLPSGLPLDKSKYLVADQVKKLPKEVFGGSFVVCVGSGTMASGVLHGLTEYRPHEYHDFYGILVHDKKNPSKVKAKLIEKSHLDPFTGINVKVLHYNYDYFDKETCSVPFPCCEYYDRKAYKWMIDNLETLKKPVLFWNIGAGY